ncbi:hypothetical protein [Fulvivirga sediminis]|uniref:Nucleotidyltransferase domain-containing protein n=1 Tax=Fulvivirga sediminis TaxID=2803949 RepID=A0A937K165_9BACT|nr:hypothetical protein [Fulvivirga sediminis]MBL3659048.1 hypothetical protein [Fulvivirga sediminis]
MELIPLLESPDEISSIILEKLKGKYGKRLLLFGVKGSVAANEFTPYSDLDYVVAINQGTANWFEYLYGTTYIDIRVVTIETLIKEMESVYMQWPLKAGSILNMRVYYDCENTYSYLLSIYEEIKKDTKQFENAVELNTFMAHYSKAYRAFQAKDFVQLTWSSIELVNQFAYTIALLNQECFISRSPSKLLKQIKAFNFRPLGWEEAMLLALTNDPEQIFKGIHKMLLILDKLKDKYEFRDFKISSISNIELN